LQKCGQSLIDGVYLLVRWIWHISRLAEFIHPFCDVHLLCLVCSRTSLPEIPLVEKVHDFSADRKYISQVTNFCCASLQDVDTRSSLTIWNIYIYS